MIIKSRVDIAKFRGENRYSEDISRCRSGFLGSHLASTARLVALVVVLKAVSGYLFRDTFSARDHSDVFVLKGTMLTRKSYRHLVPFSTNVHLVALRVRLATTTAIHSRLPALNW